MKLSNKYRDRAALKTLGGVVGLLTGLAVAARIAQQNETLDPDTQAVGMLFYGFVTVPLAILVFHFVLKLIWDSLDFDHRERTTAAQIVASLIAMFGLAFAFVGLIMLTFKPIPPAAPVAPTYATESIAVPKINSIAYPRMKILSAGPHAVQADTLDPYASVVSYYNSRTRQAGTNCSTTDLGCTEWTATAPDGTPITFSAAQCAVSVASTIDEDPTTGPVTPVSPYTILTYQLGK